MDQCAHEVRAEYWKGIIQACGQRSAGQSAKNWMDENGICEQSYYHWQRKFRQQAYEQMKEKAARVPAVTSDTDVSFVEIPCINPATQPDPQVKDSVYVALIQTASAKIGITNDISDSVLSRILQEVANA